MAMGKKKKTMEDQWASDESLSNKRKPGRPRKVKDENIKKLQLRLPQDLLDQIDELIDGGNRHAWLVKAIKDTLKNKIK